MSSNITKITLDKPLLLTPSSDPSSIHRLPKELMLYIFSLLLGEEVTSLKLVCKRWYLLGSEENLWKRLFQHNFPTNQRPTFCENWLVAYKHFYISEQTFSNITPKFELFKKKHSKDVTSLKLLGDFLISSSKDHTIKVWDTRSHLCVRTLDEHTQGVSILEIYDNSLFSGSNGGIIKMWDITENKSKKNFVGHTGEIIFLGKAEQHLISASKDKTIKIWDINTGKCVHTLEDQLIYNDSVQVKGNRLYTISREESSPTIKVRDIANKGECLQTIKNISHDESLPNLLVTESILFLSFLDSTIKIWDLNKNEYLKSIENCNKLRNFIKVQDKRLYIFFYDGTVSIWDIATRKFLPAPKNDDHENGDHENGDQLTNSVYIFGNLIFVITLDWDIKIWNTKTGKQLHSLGGALFYNPVNHLQVHQNKIFCINSERILSWTFSP